MIFGVIAVDDALQGLERSGIKQSKGFEYALTAIEMANMRKRITEALAKKAT